MAAADSNAALIVRVTARLDQFEKQMAKVGTIADKGVKQAEERFSKFNPSLGGAFTGGLLGGLLGSNAIQSLEKIIKALAAANHEMAELGETARRASVSTAELQKIQFAGLRFGVGQEAIDKGLESIARQLNDVRRSEKQDETDIGRLFHDNNILLKDRNGIVISTAAALSKIAELIRNAATEQDKLLLAEKLKIPPEMIPLLTQGADKIKMVGDSAQAAGVMIDDGIIKKAREFDLAWGEAWKKLSLNVRAYLSQWGSGISEADKALDAMVARSDARTGSKTSRGPWVGPGGRFVDTTAPAAAAPAAADIPVSKPIAVFDKEDRQRVDFLERASGSSTDAAAAGALATAKELAKLATTPGVTRDALTVGTNALRAGMVAAEEARKRQEAAAVVVPPLPPAKEVKTLAAVPPRETIIRTADEIAAQERLEKYIDTLVRQQGVEKAIQETLNQSRPAQQAAIEIARAAVDLDKLGATAKDELIKKLKEQAEKLELARIKTEEMRKAQQTINDVSRLFGEFAVDALDRLIVGGEKFADVAKDIGRQLAKAALQATLLGSGPLAGLFGTSPTVPGATGGLFGLLAGILTPKALGGPVSANQPVLVGERGPELFIPGRGGGIIPNSQLRSSGGGNTDNRTFHIDARGAELGVEHKIVTALREYDSGLMPRIRDKQLRGV